MEGLPKNKKIILFDGVCNFCDSAVNYIIKHDSKDVFRFVPLQSELGQKIANYIGVDTSKLDTFLLYEPGVAYYTKAAAAFKVAATLGGAVSLLNGFSILPKFLVNFVYDVVAKNRYKWFGKKDSCIIPTDAMKAKFL